MRIGEAARRAGVNVETFRYYERRGLRRLEVALANEDLVLARVRRAEPAERLREPAGVVACLDPLRPEEPDDDRRLGLVLGRPDRDELFVLVGHQ